MKRLFIALAMMALCSFPAASANAGDFDIKPYIGVGLGMFQLELQKDPDPLVAKAVSLKDNTFGGYVKLGADVGDYLGAEVRIGGTGTAKKSYPATYIPALGAFDAKLQTDFLVSYLLKLQFPVSDALRIYALGGGTTARGKVTIAKAGFQDSKQVSKPSYGIGLEYSVDDQSRIGVEWMQYWKNVKTGPYTKASIWGVVATGTFSF